MCERERGAGPASRGHRAAASVAEFVVSLTMVRSQIRGILAKLGSDRRSKPSRWVYGDQDPRLVRRG